MGRLRVARTLWLYSGNDRYWGADYPRRWFEGFKRAGGVGEFLQLPAHGHDGHSSFVQNAVAWKPHVERFLASLGFQRRDAMKGWARSSTTMQRAQQHAAIASVSERPLRMK